MEIGMSHGRRIHEDGNPDAVAGRAFFSGTKTRPIYVDHLSADAPGGRYPVVMVHGGCHTGVCYLTTPDGREGWAPAFARSGRHVYVVDWPGHGRSPACDDLPRLPTREVAESLCALFDEIGPAILLVHSASGPMGWWLAERMPHAVRAVVGIAPGPPANLVPPPENGGASPASNQTAGSGHAAMLPEDRPVEVDEAFIRQFWTNTPRFPKQALERYPLFIVPESARIFNERFNHGGRGLTVREPEALRELPVLIVTGDEDPRHPRTIDQATADFLNADFLWLPDRGITGNGHMLMMEDNNAAIAGLILEWLDDKKL